MPEARPYIEVSDTRRFVYILRGLLCDVIGRLAPRAQLQRGRASNDVTPYHRTTVLPQQRVAEEVRWYPRSLLLWKFRGSPAAAQTGPAAALAEPAAAWAGPAAAQAGPAATRTGPAAARTGLAAARAGPAGSRARPAATQARPAAAQ